jgi:hypothetical protein
LLRQRQTCGVVQRYITAIGHNAVDELNFAWCQRNWAIALFRDELLATRRNLISTGREEKVTLDGVLDRASQSVDVRLLAGDLLLQLLVLRMHCVIVVLRDAAAASSEHKWRQQYN